MSSEQAKETKHDSDSIPSIARSRTPKPYHHSPREVFNPAVVSRTGSGDSLAVADDEQSSTRRRGSRPWSSAVKSPSESGTEADDEGFVVFKALPAPPLRPRKGLKSGADQASLSDAPTPVRTPTKLSEDAGRCLDDLRKVVEGSQDALEEEERKRTRERMNKRRKTEIVRRACEVALLGGIGALFLSSRHGWGALDLWGRG
jgi:hypothetical protein